MDVSDIVDIATIADIAMDIADIADIVMDIADIADIVMDIADIADIVADIVNIVDIADWMLRILWRCIQSVTGVSHDSTPPLNSSSCKMGSW